MKKKKKNNVSAKGYVSRKVTKQTPFDALSLENKKNETKLVATVLTLPHAQTTKKSRKIGRKPKKVEQLWDGKPKIKRKNIGQKNSSLASLLFF